MTTNKPEVKRFHVDCNGLRVGGSPRDECDVLVVLAKDYERLQAETERLQAECEKLRKDAERYRWMRDPCSGAERVVMYGRGDYGRGLMTYTMLDEAIDAALQETPK